MHYFHMYSMLVSLQMANNLLTITQAQAAKLETNVSVQVVQIEKAKIDEQPRFKATFKIADETGSMLVTSYHATHKTILMNPVPQGLIIINAIHKGYGLVLTSRSVLSMNKAFVIPAHIMSLTGMSPVKVRDAVGSPKDSLVKIKAKVTKVRTNDKHPYIASYWATLSTLYASTPLINVPRENVRLSLPILKQH